MLGAEAYGSWLCNRRARLLLSGVEASFSTSLWTYYRPNRQAGGVA